MKKLAKLGILSLASLGILASCLEQTVKSEQSALEEKAATTTSEVKEKIQTEQQAVKEKVTSTVEEAKSKTEQVKTDLQQQQQDIRESAKKALEKLDAQKKALVAKGYQVFLQNCAACHRERISKEEEMKFRKMVKSDVKPPIKAPPMNEISARLKVFFPNEKEFVNFVKDYITNPSREKGKCLPKAFKMFGVMPAIGTSLTEDEKEAVALWLYHNFNDKWSDFSKGMNDGHNCPVKKIKVNQ